VCSHADCPQLCVVTNGAASCTCYAGYSLGQDNRTCTDIDECQGKKKICSHLCKNTAGGFQCSCLPGHKLVSDGKTCLRCPNGFYGHKCNQVCRCNGQGRCDPARGCVCFPGWEGSNCDKDVNECDRKLDNCSSRQVCQNSFGGFSCTCQRGFERTTSGACK
ncbi:unnamed protein product, partial [Candidula unifasciata]